MNLAPEAIVLKDGVGVQKTDPVKETVTVGPVAGSVPVVDAGGILVAGFSPITPVGLLVRVEVVMTAADDTQVATTEPATLTDATFATDGSVTVSGKVV
ncbi:hypothetical protein [Arthrobacter roseus]|uniref:hypothetical protein n=1 Tax=Arthrobacter roseus TaxID=136274 RepID=UPI001963A532|nr:hypothetical protein [Arthrobacter roseus]MBM7848708.1 hypothetical protein [Arthrobacter roseus]